LNQKEFLLITRTTRLNEEMTSWGGEKHFSAVDKVCSVFSEKWGDVRSIFVDYKQV
jgi:hypothetical protein